MNEYGVPLQISLRIRERNRVVYVVLNLLVSDIVGYISIHLIYNDTYICIYKHKHMYVYYI
jgi:hypothetical protein